MRNVFILMIHVTCIKATYNKNTWPPIVPFLCPTQAINNEAPDHLLLDPEVLHVLAPPFVNRPQTESEAARSHWNRRRFILRQKRELPPSAAATASPGLAHGTHCTRV